MAPYLALCKEEAEQRDYLLRDVFNGLRYVVRTGCQWRYMPHDLPPWNVVFVSMCQMTDEGEVNIHFLSYLEYEDAGIFESPLDVGNREMALGR